MMISYFATVVFLHNKWCKVHQDFWLSDQLGSTVVGQDMHN